MIVVFLCLTSLSVIVFRSIHIPASGIFVLFWIEFLKIKI